MKYFNKCNITEEWMDLVTEFPEIFLIPSPAVIEMFKSGKLDCEYDELSNLRASFECGIGWKNIIREFCLRIRELVNTAKENGHEIYYKTFILKEKFGEIRNQGDFYGADRNLYHTAYNQITRDMEMRSVFVCEETGEPGSRCHSERGWIKTLSEEVAKRKGFTVIEDLKF